MELSTFSRRFHLIAAILHTVHYLAPSHRLLEGSLLGRELSDRSQPWHPLAAPVFVRGDRSRVVLLKMPVIGPTAPPDFISATDFGRSGILSHW